MTIAESLKKYKDIEADLLLGAVLKQSKEFLYLHPDKVLTAGQTKKLADMVKKRKAGMPAAYLLGYKYFYGLEFKVNQHVLIPRPESEWLVDETLKIISQKLKRNAKEPLKVLDVGTGSGCLAISIAKNADKKRVK
ncbi:MAG TPA: HemK/PrmC family methyltransferase, partial [Patescibacteria group bacterium]|nr:HemK/PrmC family methyltransferase [Patescibacteria group bacterium]